MITLWVFAALTAAAATTVAVRAERRHRERRDAAELAEWEAWWADVRGLSHRHERLGANGIDWAQPAARPDPGDELATRRLDKAISRHPAGKGRDQ